MDLKRYREEINFIIRDLEEIVRGDFFEKTGDKISGSAVNKAKKIKERFIELLDKIQNEKESMGENIAKVFEKNISEK